MTDKHISLLIIALYLCILLALGWASSRLFRGTAKDYFVASHSIGPFLLLMSVFGTTMTAFALVGSSGKAYMKGIGVYGLMASISGLVHAAVFFWVGIKVWTLGKKFGYLTQIQYLRDRFESKGLGYLLFPILVGLVIPYLLIGLIGAGKVMMPISKGAFPEVFAGTAGALPHWLTALIICSVVLTYIFTGGLRGAIWANTLQTIVFMVMGMFAFFLIADYLGGFEAATAQAKPERLIRGEAISKMTFLTYLFVPLSVGMFPHLFQHWLTAKSAKSFKLTVVAHPLCIMLVWVPCVLIGVWATGQVDLPPHKAGAALGYMVGKLENPIIQGLLSAGILAAIMSSLDSQFMCVGSMFTNDIVLSSEAGQRLNDRQKVNIGRCFVLAIVIITYGLSCVLKNKPVFDLAVWCFSGFGGLFPIIVASLYWKRCTKAGIIAGTLAMTVSWLVLFHMSGYGGEYHLAGGIMPVTLMFSVCAIFTVGVSLISKPPSQATLNKFFPETT